MLKIDDDENDNHIVALFHNCPRCGGEPIAGKTMFAWHAEETWLRYECHRCDLKVTSTCFFPSTWIGGYYTPL